MFSIVLVRDYFDLDHLMDRFDGFHVLKSHESLHEGGQVQMELAIRTHVSIHQRSRQLNAKLGRLGLVIQRNIYCVRVEIDGFALQEGTALRCKYDALLTSLLAVCWPL